MTKFELIARIIDALVDPWNDDPEEYLDAEPIDIEYANIILKDIRINEAAAELDPGDCLPEEATPALIMEAFNCLIRARKHTARIQQLADYFADHPYFLVHAYPFLHDCHPASAPDGIEIMPFFTDSLEEGEFAFDTTDHTFTRKEVLQILSNSLHSIDHGHHFVCFYSDKMQLVTTDNPAEIVNPEEFASLIWESERTRTLFIKEVAEEDETLLEEIFGYTWEKLSDE